jgi:hypothetical protein
MATRSTIALEFADGTVGQIYCHWDGYLSNNGAILLNDYKDPFKLRELIDLGDVSSLGPTIGEKHSFDIPFAYGTEEYKKEQERRRDITTFYGRDRGESGINARYFKDYADYRANFQSEEYNYILRTDGNWYVEFYGQFDGLLTEAFEFEAKQRQEEEV